MERYGQDPEGLFDTEIKEDKVEQKLLSSIQVCENILKIKETTLDDWNELGFVPDDVLLGQGASTYVRKIQLEQWIDDKELLTVNEVMAYYPDVESDQTIRTWMKTKVIPSELIWRPRHKIHPEIIKKTVRIKKTKFERWLYGDVSISKEGANRFGEPVRWDDYVLVKKSERSSE